MDLRLFVVEPDSLRRRLICDAAEKAPGLQVVGNSASLTEPPADSIQPDIFLVEASLVVREREAALAIVERFPAAHFVLFGSHPDLEAFLSAILLPLRGYLSFNHLGGEDFVRSLQVIAHGGAVIEPIATQMLLEYLHAMLPATARPGGRSELTQREEQVLELVRQGLSNKEIALAMRISLGTARAHLRSIFRKLDVTSRAGAAAIRDRA